MTAGFELGAFDLMDTDGSPFAVETLADGTDFGNPQPIEVAIRSLMQDGSATVHEGDDNRELPLRIKISAADSAGLAQGEEALMAELYRRNTLTYTPADGWGPPTVFEVVTSSLAFTTDDLAEGRGEHYWLVRLVCEPFGHSLADQTLTLTPTTIGTARQKSYAFTVEGSARTEAALHVASSSALGNTLVYTRPGAQGFISTRSYRAGGGSGSGTTSASSNVSGYYDNDIGTGYVANVPMSVIPNGTYVPIARFATASSSGDTSLLFEVQTELGGFSTKSNGLLQMSTAVKGLTTSYVVMQVGTPFQLPQTGFSAAAYASGSVRVALQDAFGGVTVRLDNLWLAEIGTGTLTWPNTAAIGGGPAAKQVWVEPPSANTDWLRLALRGTNSDQSDAFAPETYSEGAHTLLPGDNYAFLVTDADATSTLSGTARRNFHTHSTA